MFEQGSSSVSLPLLVVVVFWLALIFCSFGLLAPHNATVVTDLMPLRPMGFSPRSLYLWKFTAISGKWFGSPRLRHPNLPRIWTNSGPDTEALSKSVSAKSHSCFPVPVTEQNWVSQPE